LEVGVRASAFAVRVEYDPSDAAGGVRRNWLSLSSTVWLSVVLIDQSTANATDGAMPQHIETAMAALFTASRLG
jgi:hypothetical protein